jgi:hypothetical protein
LQECISQKRVSHFWFREFWHLRNLTDTSSSQKTIEDAIKNQYLLTNHETKQRYNLQLEEMKEKVFAELRKIKNQFPLEQQRTERDSRYQRYLFREALFSRLEAQQMILTFNAHERKQKKNK